MFMLLLRSSLFLSLVTSFQEQVTSLETDETEVGAFSHCFQLTKRAEITVTHLTGQVLSSSVSL